MGTVPDSGDPDGVVPPPGDITARDRVYRVKLGRRQEFHTGIVEKSLKVFADCHETGRQPTNLHASMETMPGRGAAKPAMVDNEAVPLGPAEISNREELVTALDALRRHGPDGNPRARVTLQSLARATDIPVSTVHSYLSGRTLPPPEALDAIVWVLGVRGRERGLWADALDRVHSASRRPAPEAAPRTMGPPLRDFVGRTALLTEMTQQWQRSLGRSPLLLLTGTGGIGKTSLALEWAHRHTDDFPDGSLQVDLGGFGQRDAMGTTRAQRMVLSGLGVPTAKLPTDPDELAVAYHSHLAGRRTVLLLDNARDSHQVEDLVPSAPHVTTIITSRDTLRALAVAQGVTPVRVPLMDPAEAQVLLSRASGSRMDAARLDDVASVCGGLPLALRLSADALGGQTSSVRDSLSLIVDGVDHGVRGVIDSSVQALSEPARDLFIRLGAIPGRWVGLAAAEAITGEGNAMLFQELVAVNLFDPRPEGWLRHDLVSDAAAAWAANDPRLGELRERLLVHHLRAFRQELGALKHFLLPLLPDLGTPASTPRIEMVRERELDSFLGLITWALDTGRALHAAAGLDVLASNASQYGGFDEFSELLERLAHDESAPTAARWVAWRSLGRRAYMRGDVLDERRCYRTAYDLVDADPDADALLRLAATTCLGNTLVNTDDHETGLALLHQAIEQAEALGDRPWRSFAENSLGVASHHHVELSLPHYDAAIMAADIPELRELAVLPLVNAAQVALLHHDAEQEAAERNADPASMDTGAPSTPWLQRATDYLDRMNQVVGRGDVNVGLLAQAVRAHIAVARGDLDEALALAESAVHSAQDGVAMWTRCETHLALAAACHAAGMLVRAEDHARLALEMAVGLEDRSLEAQARLELVRVHLDAHNLVNAELELTALLQLDPTRVPPEVARGAARARQQIDAARA